MTAHLSVFFGIASNEQQWVGGDHWWKLFPLVISTYPLLLIASNPTEQRKMVTSGGSYAPSVNLVFQVSIN